MTSAAGNTITYAAKGNITRIEGIGTMTYGNSVKPYQVTMLNPEGTAVPLRNQSVSYTSFQRPSRIDENGLSASFTYNASGERVKMYVANEVTPVLTRYYIGGKYELDLQSNTERLYLGGDAYSAPAVLVKEAGVWNIYYICRDYLGSITHLANADGSLAYEYSYDAWGRLRDPATQVVYTPGSEPALFLGRGYTGHEHLTWFGLINMNARLYDAALGRFLSPDPYVQNPFMTQNYNRYTYSMNNPLVYIDQDGEFWEWIVAGAILLGKMYYDGYKANNNEPNPTKWDWKNANYTVSVGNNTGPAGGVGGSVGVGWNNGYTTNVGYDQNSGFGMGHGMNGSNNMYYPSYDYNKPEKSVYTAIGQARRLKNMQQQAKNDINPSETFFSTAGTLGYFMSKSNATFRITNGEYNGSQLSPKYYKSGWTGGSRARIKTYGVSKVGQGMSLGAGVATTGLSYYEIYNGSPQPITYVDAGIGTAGLASSLASYYHGIQVPVVGEVVAIYGTLRLTWDTFYYLGANYGPSKWYGEDNTKWFK